ncbi:MAG: hypothetical protein JRE28_04225 [Deltaproteobacteria bacterium]|nr:hypothetical protein [Deltaproteobacteria bacterium]
MQTTPNKYHPPVISNYGHEACPEDLANLALKRKLTKKSAGMNLGADKLYGYEGAFAVMYTTAVNVAIVVNAVALSNAAAVTLAVAVAAVVTFPGNMQNITE